MGKRINRGYEIINSMQLRNQFGTKMEVVMGHNEKAAEPFVTWQYYPGKDSYEAGHYFYSKENAVKDFFERGMREMGLDMRREYQKENAVADIENALNWHFGEDEVQGLLKDEEFMEKAIRRYDNLDHSYENDMLQDSMGDLYHELVGQKEIFNFELMDNFNEKTVHVELHDGRTFDGIMRYNPKSSISSFWLEIPAEHENEASGYEIIEARDVKEFRLESVKAVDLDGIDFEKGSLEKTEESSPESISYDLIYKITKDVNNPGILDYYDELGDCSVSGTKEEIVEELTNMQCSVSEIEKFKKHADILLGKPLEQKTYFEIGVTHGPNDGDGYSIFIELNGLAGEQDAIDKAVNDCLFQEPEDLGKIDYVGEIDETTYIECTGKNKKPTIDNLIESANSKIGSNLGSKDANKKDLNPIL